MKLVLRGFNRFYQVSPVILLSYNPKSWMLTSKITLPLSALLIDASAYVLMTLLVYHTEESMRACL